MPTKKPHRIYYVHKSIFTAKVRKLEPVMQKLLEYEAFDIPMGDTRILEIAWKVKYAGEYGEKWLHEGVRVRVGERTLASLKRTIHVVEYWSKSLKEIFEIRRRKSIPWFPIFEATVTNSEPILTAEDKINMAFREEQRDEMVKH